MIRRKKNAELIFGTDAKLQSVDPFLFNVYELRNYSLPCKMIIVIGYSFTTRILTDYWDKHCVLHERKLLVVDSRDDYNDRRPH